MLTRIDAVADDLMCVFCGRSELNKISQKRQNLTCFYVFTRAGSTFSTKTCLNVLKPASRCWLQIISIKLNDF